MNKRLQRRLLLLIIIVPLMLPMGTLTGQAEQTPKADTGEIFSTDFSEYEVGKGIPEGWKELWATSLYEIADSPSRLIKKSTGENRHLLAWEDIGEVEGDVEIATLMRVPGDTLPNPDITSFQLHLQASGQPRAINTYHLDYTGSDRSGLRIRRSVHNQQSTLASKSEAFTFHTWNHIVFQKKDNRIRAKIWPYGTEEPNEWTIEAEDDTHSSGYVGIGFYSERRTQEFAWFSVGTGDQEAERAPNNIDGIDLPQVPDSVELDGQPQYGLVVLDWPSAKGADFYEVERDGELIAQGWDATAYADYTRSPGTSATYRVRGVSTVKGKGKWSEEIEVKSAQLPEELVLPFEEDDDHPWTMHERELAFLDELEDVSSRVKVEEIGRSGEDRPMHLVRFGVNSPPNNEEIANRPTVLLTAGTHGDEKGSQEGMLFFMRDLATSQEPEVIDFLNTYAVLVIPKVNPDGAEGINRWTANPAMDPNRDFVNLETSETQVVTRILRDFQPDVVIDAHEWRGSPGSPQRGELEVSAHGNLNSYKDVRELSQELAFEHIMEQSNNHAGFRSSPYQELYGEPSRLRQIGGLKHGLTLLTETSRHPDVRRLEEAGLDEDAIEFRPRRAAATQFALHEAMRWMTKNVDRITVATTASKEAAMTNTGPLYSGGAVDLPPITNEILDPPPCGWLVSNPDPNVIDVLDLHGIKWQKQILPRPMSEGQEVLFVPAAQLARPLAFTTLDGASSDQLSTVSSLRLSEDSGWCDLLGPGDKTKLQERVTEINDENLNESEYTEESWQNLQAALAQAEEILNDEKATQPEIDDALEALNNAREQLEKIDPDPMNASTIKTHVEHFEETGEFENSHSAHALIIHLTAVERFEKQEMPDKVIRHMESFIELLDQQKAVEMISEIAYHSLKKDAETLIQQWQ